MKKTVLLFLFNFLLFSLNAQELTPDSSAINAKLLLGNWGFDYADYADGTLVREQSIIRNTATMLSFRKAKAIIAMYHAKAITMLYAIDNNKLTVGTSDYRIEKLTDRELIFSFWEDISKESYQVVRYHYLFTKESSEQFFFQRFVKPNIKIKPNGDTTFAFTEDFYPHYIVKIDGFNTYELNSFDDVFNTSYKAIESAFDFPAKKEGRFGVQFEISKTGQIADVVIKESSDSVYNAKLLKAVASTSKSWKNAEYANKPVAVQFNYMFEYDAKKQQEDNFFDQHLYDALMQRADNNFAKQNYEKAVKLYTKCILMTDDAVEALYKRADCYFTVNALKNACSDWNYLSAKGQKRAEKLYLQHCMK